MRVVLTLLILNLNLMAVAFAQDAKAELWSCSLDCGTATAIDVNHIAPKSGLAALKQNVEQHHFWKRVKWPFGITFQLSPGAPEDSGSSGPVHRHCESAGVTAEQAVKSLEARVTGVNLAIMAIRCTGCDGGNLKDAVCAEARTKTSIPYTVLKSRFNPEAQGVESAGGIGGRAQ